MPRYIAVHPKSLTMKDLKRLVDRHDEIPQDALWNRTWSGVTEPVTFCDWEAVSAGAVTSVFRSFDVPYRSVHEVLYFRGNETGAMDCEVPDARGGQGEMRRFIAVHPCALNEASLRSLVRRWCDDLHSDVQWCCTWAGVRDRVSFCDWRAPSAASIAYALGRTGIPFSGLFEVLHFDRRLSMWHDPEQPFLASRARTRRQTSGAAALSRLS